MKIFKYFEEKRLKNKQQFILELLTIGLETKESIDLFNRVSKEYEKHLKASKEKMLSNIYLIDKATFKAKEYDPNFDKKLSDLEVEFEIVTP